MKLYDLVNEFKDIERMIDDGDLESGLVEDHLESLNMMIADKVESCLKIIANKNAFILAAKSEAKRLVERAETEGRAVLWLEDYIRLSMITTKHDKLSCGTFSVTLKKAAKKLGEIDESKIPSIYFVEVPATKRLDKRKLLSDAKLSNIDGVEVVDGARALMVK